MEFLTSDGRKVYEQFCEEIELLRERAEQAGDAKKIGKQLVRGADCFNYTIRILQCLDLSVPIKALADEKVRESFGRFCLTLADSIDRLDES